MKLGLTTLSTCALILISHLHAAAPAVTNTTVGPVSVKAAPNLPLVLSADKNGIMGHWTTVAAAQAHQGTLNWGIVHDNEATKYGKSIFTQTPQAPWNDFFSGFPKAGHHYIFVTGGNERISPVVEIDVDNNGRIRPGQITPQLPLPTPIKIPPVTTPDGITYTDTMVGSKMYTVRTPSLVALDTDKKTIRLNFNRLQASGMSKAVSQWTVVHETEGQMLARAANDSNEPIIQLSSLLYSNLDGVFYVMIEGYGPLPPLSNRASSGYQVTSNILKIKKRGRSFIIVR